MNVVGIIRLGGSCDAEKLAPIVGKESYPEAAVMRLSSASNDMTVGQMISSRVWTILRFCSSQFFHNKSPNCAAFDIVMLMLDTKLWSLVN